MSPELCFLLAVPSLETLTCVLIAALAAEGSKRTVVLLKPSFHRDKQIRGWELFLVFKQSLKGLPNERRIRLAKI